MNAKIEKWSVPLKISCINLLHKMGKLLIYQAHSYVVLFMNDYKTFSNHYFKKCLRPRNSESLPIT